MNPLVKNATHYSNFVNPWFIFQGLDGPTGDTGLPGRQGTKVRILNTIIAKQN